MSGGRLTPATVLSLATVLTLTGIVGLIQAQEPAAARTWAGRTAEIETFIRDSETSNIEEIGTGVTNPLRADLEPGGPIRRISFKPVRPGIYRGYWESYKSEIAAYELDKILELGMTPPTVEKRVRGDLGAAAMWAEPTQTFKDLGGPPTPPSTHIGRFNFELIRAKMFHNLIYNRDPNLGNWLVDPSWNLILIDNSRAFTPDVEMVHAITRVDASLWERIEGLDEATLTAALGEWLSAREIEGVLERRDHMAGLIAELVEARGERDVFVRWVPPAAPAEPLSVPERSELTWVGRVVSLAAVSGPDADPSRRCMAAGLTIGLETADAGLLCLAPDVHDPEPYDELAARTSRPVEVFGRLAEVGGLPVVHATLWREHE